MCDFCAFCRYFYASRYLPIAYFENDVCLYSEGFPRDIPIYESVLRILTIPLPIQAFTESSAQVKPEATSSLALLTAVTLPKNWY